MSETKLGNAGTAPSAVLRSGLGRSRTGSSGSPGVGASFSNRTARATDDSLIVASDVKTAWLPVTAPVNVTGPVIFKRSSGTWLVVYCLVMRYRHVVATASNCR